MKNRTNENELNVLAEQYEQVILDENTTLVTYIGFAEHGVSGADDKWIIIKITSASATAPTGVTTFKYATGYKDGSNIWDNRTSLTYN